MEKQFNSKREFNTAFKAFQSISNGFIGNWIYIDRGINFMAFKPTYTESVADNLKAYKTFCNIVECEFQPNEVKTKIASQVYHQKKCNINNKAFRNFLNANEWNGGNSLTQLFQKII